MKKIGLLFLLIISCTTGALLDVPKWYLNPPKNNGNTLYGVGYGGSLDQATKLALNNISEKILVTVSSSYEANEQEARVNDLSEYASDISRSVKSKSVNIEYSNYQTEKSEKVADAIYILVSVSKDELVDNYLSAIAKTHSKIEAINNSLAGKSVVEQFSLYYAMRSLVSMNERRIKIVQTVTKNKKIVAEFQDLYKEILLNEIANQDKLLIKVVAKPSDEKISDAITEELNKLKINTTTNDLGPKDQRGALLRINTKTTHQKIYSSHIAKVQISLKLMENFGKQIASNEIEIKGSSAISGAEAVNAAIAELRDEIREQGIFEVFGL